MKNNMIKKTLLASALSMAAYPIISMASMDEMSDTELSNEVGQALLSMGYTAPSGSGTGATTTDYAYYKLGLEAKMELNLNIRNLQLGCGGRNGPGKCDIDIENLSLSGSATGKTTSATPADNGVPEWTTAGGRPNSSAVLTNPFVEFAIKNPTTAATREVVGFRLSAEEILGYMSAGTVNDIDSNGLSTGGGINSFSGYIKVGKTPVTSTTVQSIFGTREDQAIAARVVINTLWDNDRDAQTNINYMKNNAPSTGNDGKDMFVYNGNRIWGINVPSQTVSFDFPVTSVTGNRMSQLNLVVRDVPVGTWNASSGTCNDTDQSGANCAKRVAIGRDSGGINLQLSSGVLWVTGATFFMGSDNANGTVAACTATYRPADCSYITNLKANVTVKQNFNLVHNLPISSGGYLSLQKEALRWPGSSGAFTYNTATKAYKNVADNYTPSDVEVMNYGDVAQPGWWMSFKDPLDFGALNPTQQIAMDDVLPQLASYITDYLSQNTINVGLGDALSAAFGAPLYKGLGDINMAADARAVMVLQNLLLDGNQKPVSNCWGALKFC